jgi:steroid 5-alpha reductase family enzyme
MNDAPYQFWSFMMASFVVCLFACCLIMCFVWAWSKRIENAGVADIFRAVNFIVIALLLLNYNGFRLSPLALVCLMLIIAMGRLGIYLGVRSGKNIYREEGRYRRLRAGWGLGANQKFFWLFQLRALVNVLLSLPFFLVAAGNKQAPGDWELAGMGIWVIGFLGEAAADAQLAAFRRNPANKGKVCSEGLWNYSRHPNYFFEWLMWMAYFVYALGSPYGWLAVLSPVIVLYLLLKVTGIPVTEEQCLRSKGDAYENYQRQTSVFVPWFKKKN